MKNAIAVLALFALCLTAFGQQLYQKNSFGEFVPITLDTNTSPPIISGPGVDFLKSLATVTNWGVAAFGIWEPKSDNNKDEFGFGAMFLYNINKYVATGVGIDWLKNRVTMPSADVQFQLPFYIGGTNGLQVTPFAFTGIATPVGGMGDDNGSVVGIFGAGIDFRIYDGLGLFGAIEQRTGQPNVWNLFGLRYSKAF